jgi:hypothetical protein
VNVNGDINKYEIIYISEFFVNIVRFYRLIKCNLLQDLINFCVNLLTVPVSVLKNVIFLCRLTLYCKVLLLKVIKPLRNEIILYTKNQFVPHREQCPCVRKTCR